MIDQQFKETYFEYFPIALRIAFYVLKDREASEDVGQEVLLKLWEKRERLGEIKSLKAYVIRMARNSALDRIEKKKVNLSGSIELALRDDAGTEEESSRDKELRKSIEDAVSLLPPKCRLIFSLSRFEGLSNDEIAEYLEISKRTVETQISIALKAFRTDLKYFFEDYIIAIPFAATALLIDTF